METNETRPNRVCSPKYAVQKARRGKTLNRWEIEELAKDAEQSFIYAEKVLKGRFPEGELAISQNISLALAYARKITDGRFELAESHFISALSWVHNRTEIMSYLVRNGVVNKGVEKLILEKERLYISDYASKCLGCRWPEAEVHVLVHMTNAHQYHRDVVKERWPELEDRIIRIKKGSWIDDRKDAIKKYFEVVPGPNPEFLEKMSAHNKAYLLFVCAAYVIKSKLPGHLHQKMMMFAFDPKRQNDAKNYVKFLDRQEKKAIGYLSALDEQERSEIMEKVRTN